MGSYHNRIVKNCSVRIIELGIVYSKNELPVQAASTLKLKSKFFSVPKEKLRGDRKRV